MFYVLFEILGPDFLSVRTEVKSAHIPNILVPLLILLRVEFLLYLETSPGSYKGTVVLAVDVTLEAEMAAEFLLISS